MASFAELLAQNPKIRTRQALMVIGLQNDFLSPDGRLPVNTKTGFLDHVHTLIPKFRELNGHIIWVQTLYEADRLANTSSTGEGDALVIGGLVDGDESSTEGGDDESTKDLPLSIPQTQSRSAKHKQRALDLFKRVSARRKTVPVEEAKATVEEDEELFLLKRATRNPACMPETNGVQFTKDIKSLIETPRDAVIKTTNYSAFLGTNLLMTLRARLITEIFICGCLSNVSVLATVIDGARHGIKINVVQDALGYRKQTRHDLALKRMEDFFDAWLVTSADILAKERLEEVEPEKKVANPDADGSKNASKELEALVNKLSLTDKPNVASKTLNGRSSSKIVGQLKLEDSPNPDQSNATAEDNASNEELELTAALARTRRTNGAEPRSSEAGESNLVQSKTRMRSKGRKKKKKAEGSLVEPSVPKSDSSKPAAHGTVEPVAATKQADTLETAAILSTNTENDTNPKNDGMGRPLLKTSSGPAIPTNENSTDSAASASAGASPDESNKALSAPVSNPISPSLTPPSASTATLVQALPANNEALSSASLGTATVTKPSKPKSLANLPVLSPEDFIAEGDSRIVHDFIPPEYCHPSDLSKPLVDVIFQQLYSEVRWQKMLHQQGEVPRLVCCQGEYGEDGSKPVYRHPADQTLPLLHFSPKVQWIRRAAEKLVRHPLNHVLIQLYRSGNDYISEHSDKTLDIAKDSSIVNVSFGAQRTMRLRTKRNSKTKEASGDEYGQRETQRIAMPHNSMFVLGLKSNEKWLHGIMADKRIEAERSELETAYSGARISLTFRHIATYLDAKETTIWGQGATSKDQRGAADVINDDDGEAERMIRAFSRENHSTNFEWDEWYGPGFDVVHLHEPPEQLPIVFANNRDIETKQIRIALWESKVHHTLLEAPSLDKERGSAQRVHFRDNDISFTEISGLLPILHYIDRYYPFSQSPDSKPVTAAAYSIIRLLSQVSDFNSDCPAPLSSIDLTAALHMLGEQLRNHGGPFIAGKRFSIADCLVWPVLDELVEKWEGWDKLEFSELAEYYRMAWKKKACLKKVRSELLVGRGRSVQ